eukprot:2415468-Prymnesium_polylepis.1
MLQHHREAAAVARGQREATEASCESKLSRAREFLQRRESAARDDGANPLQDIAVALYAGAR